jgi:hypothetical protein
VATGVVTMSVRPATGFAVALLVVASVAWAQGLPRLAEVELGFRGVPVADAWNPVRLLLRDVGDGRFTLVVDQGSLRQGALPWTVVLPVTGGGGVRTVDLDLYLPTWRTLRWTVEAGGAILASGSLARADADRRPVDLVVSSRPGDVASSLPGRVLDVSGADLPARAAAYDGVRSIWLDGSAPRPGLASLAAAAAAGAVVVVQGEARDDPELAGLRSAAAAAGGWWAVGAGGWWFGDPPSDVQLTAGRLDLTALATAFAAAGGVALPPSPPPTSVALVVALYVVLIAVAWRIGGRVGAVTWVWVMLAAITLSLTTWRPDGPTAAEVRELRVGAGGLAVEQRAYDLLTLPAGPVSVPAVARPTAAVTGRVEVGATPRTVVELDRWRGITVLEAPRATDARLAWGPDGRPRVQGDTDLSDVRVVGLGAWRRLAPGATPADPSDPPGSTALEATFEALLPTGTAWARSATGWHVLPPLAGRFEGTVRR